MMTLYRYSERIKFMLFRVQFWEKYDQLFKVDIPRMCVSVSCGLYHTITKPNLYEQQLLTEKIQSDRT